MSKEPEPENLVDRLKSKSLAFWGALCLFSGAFSYLAMQLMIDAAQMRRAEEQASQIGGAVAGGLFVIVGLGLIVAHFVRRT